MSIDRIGGASPVVTDTQVQEVEARRQQESPPAQAADGVDTGGQSYMFNTGDGMDSTSTKANSPSPPPSAPSGGKPSQKSPILESGPPPPPGTPITGPSIMLDDDPSSPPPTWDTSNISPSPMLNDDLSSPPPANGPSFGPSEMLQDAGFEHDDGSSSNRT